MREGLSESIDSNEPTYFNTKTTTNNSKTAFTPINNNRSVECLNNACSMQSSSSRFIYPNDKKSYVLLEGASENCVVQAAVCLDNQKKVAIKRINLEECNCLMEEFFVSFWFIIFPKFFFTIEA